PPYQNYIAFTLYQAITQERRGTQDKSGGLRPALPIQSDARRNGGEGIGGGKTLRIRLANRRDLFGHALRRDVAARLEVGVDEIVERMKGLIPDAVRSRFRAVRDACVRGRPVRVDRLLPQSQTREDVARHVKRVRRRRRDLRVAAGGGEGAARERRRIVAMDDVVGHPGVVRLLGEYLFENRASLELVGVGLVGGGRGGIQGEGI